MLMYFAGAEKNYAKIVQKYGGESILQSAYYMNYKKQPNELGFKNFLLDSGGFTAIMKNQDIPVKQYIDYINHYKVKFAITMDVPSVAKTLQNYEDLQKYTDAKILPVMHDTDYFSKYRSILDKYLETDYICIAGLTRNNYSLEQKIEFGNFVFNLTRDKIKVHGLAMTNVDMCLKWPFYSVDATTWLNADKFGTMMKYKNFKIEHVLSVRANKGKVQSAEQFVNEEGRLKSGVVAYSQFEKDVTRLWKARGVEWK